MFERKWRRCPHVRIRGIHGDEINYTPKFRRLECLDCGRHLDGPVSLAGYVSINGGIFPARHYGPGMRTKGASDDQS